MSKNSHAMATMLTKRLTPASPTKPQPSKRTSAPSVTLSRATALARPAGYSIFSKAMNMLLKASLQLAKSIATAKMPIASSSWLPMPLASRKSTRPTPQKPNAASAMSGRLASQSSVRRPRTLVK